MPERELEEVRKELEEVKKEFEEELALYRSEAVEDAEEGQPSAGGARPNPVLSLLLELESEVRKADHVLTVDNYSPDRLRWILDRLDVARARNQPESPANDVLPDQGSMERMRDASNGPV